jgi:hypothetical protein
MSGRELDESLELTRANLEAASAAHDAFVRKGRINPDWFEIEPDAPAGAALSIRTIDDIRSCFPENEVSPLNDRSVTGGSAGFVTRRQPRATDYDSPRRTCSH